MRLRWVAIAMAILFIVGVFVFAQRRARAENDRDVSVQADAVEVAAPRSAAVAAPATSADAAPVRAAVVAAPAVHTPAASVDVAPLALPTSADSAPNPGVTVRFDPQTNFVPGPVYYTVAAPGDDPETNELMAQDQQLEQEVQSLARQLADTDDDKQRAEFKDKLASALEKQFDAQQKLRQLEISRIEARIQKLRDLVHKRTDSRRKIIENRLEQILNDAEGLGWNSAKGSGFQFVPHGPAGMGMPAAPRSPNLPTPPSPARR